MKLTNEISMEKRYSTHRREDGEFAENEKAKPQDLVGIYGDLAEIIGVDNVAMIYKHFKGQQVSFPTRLYSKDFIARQVSSDTSQPIKNWQPNMGIQNDG